MANDCVQGHRAFIHDRGGIQRITELVNLNMVKWGRVRDDISEAQVNISAVYCDPQAQQLNQLEPGRHELVIYRGDERVWEGPVGRLVYTSQGVEIYAKDICQYLFFTAMESAYDNSTAGGGPVYVTNRAQTIITTEMTRRNVVEHALNPLLPDVNVLPYLVNHHLVTDAKTLSKTVAMQYTVFEHVDNLAADYGMDYTVLGRALHLWDTHENAMGETPTATEADFLGDLNVTVYGQELGTRSISTDGQGVWGDAGGADTFYGLWERLTTAYDETTDPGPPPSQAQLKSQAIRDLDGRNPTPLQLHIPDGSTVNPNGVLNVDNLVPGVWIPLRATLLTRDISQVQKLDSMTCTEDSSGETITATMYPAPGA